MFEGTLKYFLLIFLIYIIVYITKKISLYFLFKVAKQKPYTALIPIYTTAVLVKMLNMKKTIFYMCLIPGINLFFYHQIYKQLLLAFGQKEEDAIFFDLIPMYKFPQLVFKRPRFILNEYDLTREFLENQNILFDKNKEVSEMKEEIEETINVNQADEKSKLIIKPINYEQMPNDFYGLESAGVWTENKINLENNSVNNNVYEYQINNIQSQNVAEYENKNIGGHDNSVFNDKRLEPDKRHEKIFVVENKTEEHKNPIAPYKGGRPQMCPKCGAKLANGVTTCFLCGTKLQK